MKAPLCILILFLLASCAKEAPPNPTPPNALKLKWQVSLREDNEYSPNLLGKTVILKNEVVFSYDAVTASEKLLFVNKIDNELHYRFLEIKGNLIDEFYSIVEGIICFDHNSIYVGQNSDNMKMRIKSSDGLIFRARNNFFDEQVYCHFRNDQLGESTVVRINIKTTEIIRLKTMKDIDFPGYDKVTMGAPTIYRLSNGREIINYNYLLWKNNWADYYNEVKDLNTDELLWIDSTGKTNPFQDNVLIFQDKIITTGTAGLNCINPLNGDIIWSCPAPENRGKFGWSPKNLLLENNKVVFISDGHFIIINADDGTIEYDSPLLYASGSGSKLTHFEGVYYWSAISMDGYSMLYGFRADDRKMVIKMKSPNAGKAPYYNDTNFDWNGLQIDPETRLGYTSDGFFAMCFEIPEKYP